MTIRLNPNIEDKRSVKSFGERFRFENLLKKCGVRSDLTSIVLSDELSTLVDRQRA